MSSNKVINLTGLDRNASFMNQAIEHALQNYHKTMVEPNLSGAFQSIERLTSAFRALTLKAAVAEQLFSEKFGYTREALEDLQFDVKTKMEGFIVAKEPAQAGDTLLVSISGRKDAAGDAFGATSTIEVPSLLSEPRMFVAGLEEEIVGMAVGETKEINVGIPTSSTNPETKEVTQGIDAYTYSVTVRKISTNPDVLGQRTVAALNAAEAEATPLIDEARLAATIAETKEVSAMVAAEQEVEREAATESTNE